VLEYCSCAASCGFAVTPALRVRSLFPLLVRCFHYCSEQSLASVLIGAKSSTENTNRRSVAAFPKVVPHKNRPAASLADIDFRARQHRNSSIGVRQVCQGIVMVSYHDARRCDGVCSAVSVGGQHDIKSATEGCPAGGIDAKLSLKPAHDETLDAKSIKLGLQGSQIKPVRRSLLEDQFI
jgi:hypothetical protein